MGDEVAINTVITKSYTLCDGSSSARAIGCIVEECTTTVLVHYQAGRSSAALSWSCGQCGGGGQFEDCGVSE